MKLMQTLRAFGRNESGAALVEYSLLIGLITAAVVITVIAVGGWVNGEWVQLNAALQAAP